MMGCLRVDFRPCCRFLERFFRTVDIRRVAECALVRDTLPCQACFAAGEDDDATTFTQADADAFLEGAVVLAIREAFVGGDVRARAVAHDLSGCHARQHPPE